MIVLGSLAKSKGFLFFVLMKEIKHCDEGATSHEGIEARFVTVLFVHVLLDVLVVDVRVGFKQLLVETGSIQRLQIHLD